MNADVLTTTVADGIAVVTLGSARRIYFDAEMGDVLTEALEGFAGDPSVRVVIITGGAPGYFNRHFDIPSLIKIAAGVHQGDIIVTWNGEPVRHVRSLLRALGPDSVGQTVTLGLRRGGETKNVALTIAEWPTT